MPNGSMTVSKRLSLLLAAGMLPSHGALAIEPQVDKSQYNLFNPTPPRLMRELEPDRPDLTDSPFTVDAGHVQLETDLLNYTRSRPDRDKTVTEEFLFGPTEIRIGITNSAELDLLVQPFNAVRTHFAEPIMDTWEAGPDVLEISARFNLLGNDAFDRPGAIAVGLKPFVEVPTVRNGVGNENVEGGLVIPIAIKLAEKIEAELMTEYDLVKSEEESGYHVEYFNSASLTYELTPAVTTYIEAATVFGGKDPGGPVVILGAGVLFELSKNFAIDFASNFGITETSDRINLVVGLTKRF